MKRQVQGNCNTTQAQEIGGIEVISNITFGSRNVVHGTILASSFTYALGRSESLKIDGLDARNK